jgi:response regulator NasT
MVPRLRVLVAQSKGLRAARLKAQLELLGHEVVRVATDGPEAITSARNLRPDLILMDAHLPLLNGIEIAREIMGQRAIPIVLITGYASTDLVRIARAAGVMANLVTPAERGQLRSAIEEGLGRFREFEALRAEASDLEEALAMRLVVEEAKRILMKWLDLSEAEAFRRMARHGRNTGRGFGEIASTIVKADKLLLRQLNLAECLQRIFDALRSVEGMPSRAAQGSLAGGTPEASHGIPAPISAERPQSHPVA